MALTFVYFYKKDSTKNISKKAEFLTNQVLNLCSEENVELEKYLTYEERPSKILDQVERVTRSKVRKIFKVQWEHHTESEATWEQEEFLKS